MLIRNEIFNSNYSVKFNRQNKVADRKKSFNLYEDSINFKSKLVQKSDNKTLLRKIFGFFASIIAIKNVTDQVKSNDSTNLTDKIDFEWNSENMGYKVLKNAGFSDEIIDKTLVRMKQKDADILKIGLNKCPIKDSEEMISEIYNGFNNSLKNEEEATMQTFKLLSKIFEQREEGRVYINNVSDAIKKFGIDVFKKGNLNDGGFFGDNFAFIDKNGKDITSNF